MPTYSTDLRIREVAAMLPLCGVRHVVACPGSRNAPIVHTLANTVGLILHSVTDERSAGFVAIGIADATSECVAVCCTSGSALLGLAPAIAEAYYRRVPLLVISGDRPAKWIGQMDGQTLDQNGTFGSMARTFCLPENDTDLWHSNRLINEAFGILKQGMPTHINIPLPEPLFAFSEEPLPQPRIITTVDSSSLPTLLPLWKEARRPIIIVGQMKKDEQLQSMLKQLAKEKQCIVMAEHLSNMQSESFVSNFDQVLARSLATPEMEPDMVLYIGGHIVSKRIKQYIRKIRPANCWHVMPSDVYADLFMCMTHRVVAEPKAVIGLIEQSGNKVDRHEFCKLWQDANNLCQATITDKWTEQNAVGIVISQLGPNSLLSLANSSTVRYAQCYTLPEDTLVQCNRGVNGIEGSMSAAVGAAMVSQSPTTYITGDLSFFYDMNALWSKTLPQSFTIVMLNNGIGEIFHHLPGLEASEHVEPYIAAGHQTNAEGWASDCHISYFRVSDTAMLREALSSPQTSARLIECIF